MPTPYEAQFPVGTVIRIADRNELERFQREWKFHHPLTVDQLEFAGELATVGEIGFYHGGDPVYSLKDVHGVWHEVCLSAG
jgi:hypothetical protein